MNKTIILIIAFAPALLAAPSSCTVSPPEGQLQCDGDEDCPPGWYCNTGGDGLCYSDNSGFPDADTDMDTDTDTDTDTDADTDTDTDADTDTDTDADTDTDTDTTITPPDCDGAAMIFDFESGASGFTHESLGTALDPWERGTPSDEACHSGTDCFTTILIGSYDKCQSAQLLSPIIDLSVCSGEPQNLELAFYHYYAFQAQDGAFWRDGGSVQLSNNGGVSWQTTTPSVAYEGTIEGNYTGPCGGAAAEINGLEAWSGTIPAGVWEQVTVPIGDTFKTDDFRFRFLFGSDRTGEQTGWFIDDVEIVVN